MGHHPGDITAPVQAYSGTGLAPITWMLIIIGIAILGFIIYYVLKINKYK